MMRCLAVLALTVLTLLMGVFSTALAAPDVKALSHRFDQLYRADSSRGELRMTVHTPHHERTLTMKMLSKGLTRTLVRITAPRKERGITSLKRGTEMWNYLPKIKRTIRVPPSMMMGSWMGSDFTNDDLMRESSWESDYTVTLAEHSTDERPCLAYVPKPEAAVTWSKVTLCFEGKTELPTEQIWYDEKGRRARTMVFSEVRQFGDRTVPAVMRLTSDLKPDQWTRIEYLKLELGVACDDSDFSQSAMRRGR